MGYGNKSVSGVHPILKHMNKLGGNPEIKNMPIKHDMKPLGRGGKLGAAEYEEKGMPAYRHKKDKGIPMHNGYPHKRQTIKGKGKGGQNIYVSSQGHVTEGTNTKPKKK